MSMNYNTESTEASSTKFTLTVTPHDKGLEIELCTKDIVSTALPMLHVGTPTGFVAGKGQLENMETVKRVENGVNGALEIYLDNVISEEEECLTYIIPITRIQQADELTDAFVKAYLYYTPNIQKTVFYPADVVMPPKMTDIVPVAYDLGVAEDVALDGISLETVEAPDDMRIWIVGDIIEDLKEILEYAKKTFA